MSQTASLVDTQVESKALAQAKLHRTMRAEGRWCFRDGIFFDPGMEIMLKLFVAYEEQEALTVGEATTAGGIPQTTGLRWIVRLENLGYLVRRQDPTDKRRFFVALSEDGHARMVRWLAHTAR